MAPEYAAPVSFPFTQSGHNDSLTSCEDIIVRRHSSIPAPSWAVTIPHLGGGRAFDEGEDDDEPHDDVHRDDEHPEQASHPPATQAQPQQRHGKRRLAPGRSTHGKEPNKRPDEAGLLPVG